MDKLYLLIIIIGLTSLLVILYYNRILKNLLRVLSDLLKLQETRDNDVEAYIRSIAKKLRPVGIEHISYKIHYLNKTISAEEIQSNNTIKLTKDIFYKNINGSLRIQVKSDTGEYKIINKLILYVITLQIVNAIYTDIEKINESFARIAKLQTYMMHDLKNILQFFQAMQYNVENIHTQEQQTQFIQYLQTSTKPINAKVNKILSLLQVESSIEKTLQPSTIELRPFLEEYINQYSLHCTIFGDAVIHSQEEYLRTIFENIFSNIHYKTAMDPLILCTIHIQTLNDKIHIEIQDSGEKFTDPKNISQPFYTTKKEGLGIGMYQAKTLAELLDGTLKCENKEDKPHITLTLPKV